MKTLINLLLTNGLLFAIAVSSAMAQRTIEIVGTDNMKFDVTSIKAAPGEEITIIYTTKSSMPKQAMAHNVVVMDRDADLQGFITAAASAKDTEYIAPGFENQVIAATPSQVEEKQLKLPSPFLNRQETTSLSVHFRNIITAE